MDVGCQRCNECLYEQAKKLRNIHSELEFICGDDDLQLRLKEVQNAIWETINQIAAIIAQQTKTGKSFPVDLQLFKD